MEGRKYETYPGHLNRLKISLQGRVMEILLMDDIHDLDKVDAWIQAYSEKFRVWFDDRKDDLDFLRRCETEKDVVAEEFIKYLKS